MNFSEASLIHSLPGPILITGHTGFKGTWLTLLLERVGIDVVGYSLAPEKGSLFERANRFGVVKERFADIRDSSNLNKFIKECEPSAIIHMAAQPLVLESYRIPRETFDVNVMGTVNLLDAAFAEDSVEAIIIVTTDKVYRNDNSNHSFIESDPLAGKDPYSASKVGTEAAVAAWQQIAKVSSGPKVVSVRAGNVIGGGDWAQDRLIPDLIRSFSSGKQMIIRNPASTRPWQHVLDPLSGYLLTLEAVLSDQTISSINFGPDSVSLEVSQIVDIASKTWGRETYIELDVTKSINAVEAESLQLDAEYSRKILGWSSRWSQEAAVISTIQWWDKVLNHKIKPLDACRDDMNMLLIRS